MTVVELTAYITIKPTISGRAKAARISHAATAIRVHPMWRAKGQLTIDTILYITTPHKPSFCIFWFCNPSRLSPCLLNPQTLIYFLS